MAKKATSSRKPAPKGRTTTASSPARAAAAAPPATTRNSGTVKVTPAREITHEMIARRAYEIYASGRGGSADDNWRRAERELRG